MTLEEIQTKHAEQWKEYHAARDKAYLELTQKHQELHDAFFNADGGKPQAIKERMRNEWNEYEDKWNGKAEKELRDRQKKDVSDWLKLEKFKIQLEQQTARQSVRGRDDDR